MHNTYIKANVAACIALSAQLLLAGCTATASQTPQEPPQTVTQAPEPQTADTSGQTGTNTDAEPVISYEENATQPQEPGQEQPLPEAAETGTQTTYSFNDGFDHTECNFTEDPANDRYEIEYVWDGHSYTQAFDEDTYNRIRSAVDYILEDKDTFCERASRFSHLNTIKDADVYCTQMLFSYTSRYPKEGELYLQDIERIRDGIEPTHEYTLYDDIYSTHNTGTPDAITDYYDGSDENVRIVDYDTYTKAWDYYTYSAIRPYSDPDKDYAILARLGFSSFVDLKVDRISEHDGVLDLKMFYDANGVMASGDGAFLVIPVEKGTVIGKIEEYGPSYKEDPDYIPELKKPVIYLYGYEGDTEVKLGLGEGTKLTCAYPEYQDGWQVKASPDGHLKDSNGRSYRYLYWEAETEDGFDFSEGFCVKGSDTAAFLEDTLPKLGLNSDEMDEFIIYWLPQMQDNPYNIISFQTDALERMAKLNVTPAPDRMVRVYMAWKASAAYVEMPGQKIKDLTGIQRTGKTVVEWGGSKIR